MLDILIIMILHSQLCNGASRYTAHCVRSYFSFQIHHQSATLYDESDSHRKDMGEKRSANTGSLGEDYARWFPRLPAPT